MAFSFNQGDRPLEGYAIQRGVGRGGFGEVYYAVSDGGKEVALKYLRDNPSIELRGVSHCLNLKSPHLVSIYDVRSNIDDEYFVVMEYINGPSLRDLLLSSPGGLGAQKAAYLLREIGKGLAYLHDRGIVHRDLKPGNVFYDEGYVKIGDYGLSKFMTASQHSGQTVSVGTVHYMAPEIGSGNYDRTIDIYAMGVMLYEMLLGRVPFAGATVGEILMKHLTAQPEVDELPPPFPAVIRKALAKDPKDRFQTVEEMIAAIFAEGAVDRSVAAFEPASLSKAAEQAVGGRPAGRGAGVAVGSSNIGTFRDSPASGETVPLPHRRSADLPGRAERVVHRVQAGAERMVGRIDGTRMGRRVVADISRRSLAERLAIALLIVFGFSFFATLLMTKGPFPISLCLKVAAVLATMVQGVLLGCWLVFERYKSPSPFLARVVATFLVGLVLLTIESPLETVMSVKKHSISTTQATTTKWGPRQRDVGPVALVYDAAVATRTAQPIALPLLLLVLVGDWSRRYYTGRKGEVSIGLAFSAWLFTLIVSSICDVKPAMPVAIIAAGASLAVQTVAGLWPLSVEAAARHVYRTRRPRTDDDHSAESDVRVFGPVTVVTPGAKQIDAHVGVERGFDAGGRKGGATRHDDAAFLRSPTVRSLWMIIAVLTTCTSVVLLLGIALVARNDVEMGAYLIAGVNAGLLAMFSWWRALAKIKRGIWRDLVRPFLAVLLIGGAASSILATTLIVGTDEAIFGGLAGAMFCVALGVGLWMIPVRQHAPPPPPEEIARRTRRRGVIAFVAGVVVFVMMIIAKVVIIDEVLRLKGPTEDAATVAVVLPLLTLSIGLMIWGGQRMRRKARARPKLTLPLRRVFLISDLVRASERIERHFALLGYTTVSRGDMLWQFERGSQWSGMWDSNIRRHRTQANLAGYRLDTGGWRLVCYVDVDSSWGSTPNQKQLTVLMAELDDLRDLLGARDAEVEAGQMGPAVIE
jgi:hypothetical protein